ncbi:MAG: UPF0262 family protein [Hyphomicrobiales bacterium]|nr:UPF0262 family protein [Hyphomicrobiales bacterium]
MTDQTNAHRLLRVTLDPASIARGSPDQEQEKAVAIYDLVEQNQFAVPGHPGGPYALFISLHDAKLALDIRDYNDSSIIVHILSLTPFRRILKDYFLVCETYYEAIRTATPAQIEAIDMGRRALHNEGATLLEQRLAGKINCDFDTIRRLFTLVTALHWKG